MALKLVILSLLFVCDGSVALVQAQESSASATTIRDVADKRDIRIGAMILDDGWREPAQQTLVAREFNAATIGAYWPRTHPGRDRWDWKLTDEAVEFATRHGLAVHLHPLLYPADDKNPAWVRSARGADAEEILSIHIRTAMARYRGRCAVWDVVNEAVAPDGRGLRDGWWRRALGPDYIVATFRRARENDPDAALIYNEYDCEVDEARQNRRWQQALGIVRELHAAKLIDGFGWQLHTTPDHVLGDAFALDERMSEIAALGLDNYVTELDVAIPDGSPASLARQAAAYRQIAQIWLRHRGAGWFQTWGVSDRHTWLDRPGESPRRPLLFDSTLQPKPSYYALVELLTGLPP